MSAVEELDIQPDIVRACGPCHTLTPREVTILQLSMEGLTSEEVGQRLFLSVKTIKAHKASMYRKLHAANIVHAVAIYLGAVE